MVLPNQLTVLRIILTPVFLFLFISDNPMMKQLSLAVFIIAAVTDWYDGWLARKFNYITNWGKFMDPLADKILTSTAFFAFVYLGVLEMWMVVVIVFRDFMVTGLRLYADTKGESMTTSYMAKWKTFIQMAFIYYLLAVYTLQTVGWIYNGNENVFRMLTSPALINVCMLIITALTIYTGVAYLFTNRKLLERFFQDEK